MRISEDGGATEKEKRETEETVENGGALQPVQKLLPLIYLYVSASVPYRDQSANSN